MKFTCEINLDNAAFYGGIDELQERLWQLGQRLKDVYSTPWGTVSYEEGSGIIRDSNGNKVGKWEIKESDND